MAKTKKQEEKEVKEEIIEDIEEKGVPKEIAKKEEKIAEEVVENIEKEQEKIEKKEIEIAEEIEEKLEKKAEEESTTGEKNIEKKKKELFEKAKKLKEKISADDVSTEELKKKIKIKKRTDMLLSLEDYVKSGIYIGTKVITPDTRQYVYRRRADGLAIFNTDLIDEKLKEGIEFLSKFAPEDVILVCKRQAGWKSAQMFGKFTGIKVFTKKYPAGILTNIKLPEFFENELTIISDSWLDRNALSDTIKINKKILMICDTNNFSRGASQVVIGNNKSEKSLGVIFYLLAKGYCKARKINDENIPELEMWTGEMGDIEQEAKRKARLGARYGV